MLENVKNWPLSFPEDNHVIILSGPHKHINLITLYAMEN